MPSIPSPSPHAPPTPRVDPVIAFRAIGREGKIGIVTDVRDAYRCATGRKEPRVLARYLDTETGFPRVCRDVRCGVVGCVCCTGGAWLDELAILKRRDLDSLVEGGCLDASLIPTPRRKS